MLMSRRRCSAVLAWAPYRLVRCSRGRVKLDLRKSAFLSVIVVAGLLLVYLVYRPVWFGGPGRGARDIPPTPLSSHPFHQSFVNEEVCLNCHAQGKELPAFDLVAPEVGHEPRGNCVSCHLLPSRA